MAISISHRLLNPPSLLILLADGRAREVEENGLVRYEAATAPSNDTAGEGL